MKILACVLLCLSILPACAAPSRATLITEMEASLRDAGPKATLLKYFGDTRVNNPAWATVESGNKRAIEVFMAILPVSDGAVSEMSSSALAIAMGNNPRLLLSLFADKRDSLPCVPDFYEGTTKARERVMLDRIEHTLQRVHDKALLASRNICLKQIAQAKAHYHITR